MRNIALATIAIAVLAVTSVPARVYAVTPAEAAAIALAAKEAAKKNGPLHKGCSAVKKLFKKKPC